MDAGAFGTDVFIAPNATVLGDVALGDRVGIWFGAVVRADRDRVAIGADSNIQDNCVVHTTPGHPVIIGREVSVGHGAVLHGCTIGDRVLVGMGAIVLNGAVVSEDTVIGAGAVVTEGTAVPPGSVVIGVPGRVVKQTSDEQRAQIRRNAASYVELARRYRDAA
ncbi:MAG: gamma carbonic anhydrase family protein [Methanospirillum sp.]|nr:gamma carbonic anhydrase family protein [Methanospirillum sp.]